MVRTGKIPLFVPTLKSGPGETLRLKRRRGNEDEEAGLPERPYVIPTLKSGPSEPLRLKRSAVSGPRLWRGKSEARESGHSPSHPYQGEIASEGWRPS